MTPLDKPLQPLPSEILRRERQAAEEAQNGIQWRNDSPPEVGRRVLALLNQVTDAPQRVLDTADDHRRVGGASGSITANTSDTLSGKGSDSTLDAIAAVIYAIRWLAETDKSETEIGWQEWGVPTYHVAPFVETVNDLLLGARVDWHFSEGAFVQRGSSVLHAELVKPVTVLLDSDPKFARASQGFSTAITRLSAGQPDVAITDAATAMQEFFRALGADGNSISHQLDVAQRANRLTSADRKLLKPLTDWMNADRSTRGNAHHLREGDVTKADAWLIIHVAAALMVRLSNEEPRDILAAREQHDVEAARARAEAERVAAEIEARGAAEIWATPSNYNDETPF